MEVGNMSCLVNCIGAIAQLVEHPSKLPFWCNSTEGSNHASRTIIEAPSVAVQK